MREITDIRQGWRYSVCNYPQGTVVDHNPWRPTTLSSIWDGKTQIPEHTAWEAVDLPHIWNLDEPADYGPRLYEKDLELTAPGGDNRYYLAFGGVFGLCRVFLNGRQIAEHRGGYTRFCVDLTESALEGKNTVTIFTDNTVFADISPLSGDFAKYGGIYRETDLIRTGKTHFDLLYYGSEGILVDTQADGTTKVQAKICGGENAELHITVSDHSGNITAEYSGSDTFTVLKVENPTLWNGKKNPYLYILKADLVENGVIADTVSLRIGYRDASMTADHGFFLNGEHIIICGVAKHQDRAGCGPAQSDEQLDEDMAIIKEVGANAIRLSHYQHPQYFYDLCDKEGMLVWAEIPMLAMPDNNEGVMENARYQITELIMQNRHHPSIVFWGVQNEVAIMGETLSMPERVRNLHELVKRLKPDAITASANEYTVKPRSELNQITDIQGYNLYYGWYYGEFEDLGKFFDKFRAVLPNVPLGISEYGADSNLTLHQADPHRQDYSEEYQSMFHEAAYPQIREREWVWGCFIWNMFEFCSPHRAFEPLYGLNRKGLVTYDRAVRKDSFYYYQAWWTETPMLHLCEKRYKKRVEDTTVIKVYSNQSEVSLEINGQQSASVSGHIVFLFPNVKLNPGVNRITARSNELIDTMEVICVEEPEQSYIYADPNPGFNVKDWVTGGKKSEDLFPEDRCSVIDEMRVLSSIPEAWAILEKDFPEFTEEWCKNSATAFLRIINRVSSQYNEEFIKEINQKLNSIEKPH